VITTRVKAIARFRGWARRIPWHNWIFAGYYLFFGLQGLAALVHTPSSIEGVAGTLVTLLWGVAALGAGVIGVFGALRPNFRAEIAACWFGIVGTFAYSSTIWFIVVFEDAPTRQAQGWAIAAHMFPLLLRLVYIYRETHKETERLAKG